MDTGMLWFDNDKKRDLNAKVSRAATYYHEKYGKVPNLCFVHPTMISLNGERKTPKDKRKLKAGEVEVRPAPSVLPNHFWIGVSGKENGKN